ncbi:MAG: bifunctional serine/threonine-protein kinase/formylglycine-generating enzyme family protein, partial [Isosphaeraceae bacterium]
MSQPFDDDDIERSTVGFTPGYQAQPPDSFLEPTETHEPADSNESVTVPALATPLERPNFDDQATIPDQSDTGPLSGFPEGADSGAPPTVPLTTDTPMTSAAFGAVDLRDQAGSWGTVESTGQLREGQIAFGRYLAIRLLGRGGMGTVWLVRHLELDIERALKMIVAGIAYDPQARGRFRREAQVMAKFSEHPNAVTVHDARLTESDVAFIEMEYVRGPSLDKVLRKGVPMSLDWTARILAQLCDVLQVAHDHQIVHRDLKPSNLMLVEGRPEGHEFLKVLDFGIAKVLGVEEIEGDPHTMTGAFMGTPPYTSPEQAEGRADPLSDIYSVGVILFEFLTGRRPYTGSPARLITATLTQPPPSFAAVNPDVVVPPEVERVVQRCLSKNPADRPQSARALAEEFLRAVPALAMSSNVVQAPPSPPSWILRGAFAASLLAALGLGGVVAWNRKDVSKPNDTIGLIPVTNKIDRVPKVVKLPDGYEALDPNDLVGAYPRVIRRKTDGVQFIRIPGSEEFQMGGIGPTAGQPEPPPGKAVAIGDFYLQDAEVTNGEMRAYFKSRAVGVAPETFDTAYRRLTEKFERSEDEADRHPAVGVAHEFAEDFAATAGGRLPTSAEWEFAARSLGRADRPYVWDSAAPPEMDDARANIDSTTKPGSPTLPVKSFNSDRTEQGIFDLIGNVREWCQDKIVYKLQGGQQEQFVVRGGSWSSPADLFSTTASEALPGSETL